MPDTRGERTKELLKKLIPERAQRLKVSQEEARRFEHDRPLFFLAAEERAKLEGTSAEAILSKYAQRILESNYPTDECLTPDELLDYQSGTLPEARLVHLDRCDACTGLLAASRPTETELVRFRDKVHAILADTAAQDHVPSSAAPIGLDSGKRLKGAIPAEARRHRVRIAGWAPALAGAIAVLVIGLAVGLWVPRSFFAYLIPSEAQEKKAGGIEAVPLAIEESQKARVPDTREMQVKLDAMEDKLNKNLQTLQAKIEETEALALSSWVAPLVLSDNPTKTYKKGDIIYFATGEGIVAAKKAGTPTAFVVADPDALNQAKARWLTATGLQPVAGKPVIRSEPPAAKEAGGEKAD